MAINIRPSRELEVHDTHLLAAWMGQKAAPGMLAVNRTSSATAAAL